jgi:choline dehydrogenase-like flavoprotein
MVIEEPNVDAVVIGAGASGSLIAAKLAVAGKRTLLLDAGPGWTTADLISSPIWSRRLKWDAGTTTTGAQPINVGFNAGYGFGGSALHHYACWFRLHPEDFRMQSLYGRGQDWPISYDELRPFYDQVQREMGLSGDATAEVWRPAGDPYPMPPLADAAGDQFRRVQWSTRLHLRRLVRRWLPDRRAGEPACHLPTAGRAGRRRHPADEHCDPHPAKPGKAS